MSHINNKKVAPFPEVHTPSPVRDSRTSPVPPFGGFVSDILLDRCDFLRLCLCVIDMLYICVLYSHKCISYINTSIFF